MKSEKLAGSEALWERYKKLVYPAGMSQDQERDTALAFFAGIETAFRVLDLLVEEDAGDDRALKVLTWFREDTKQLASRKNLERANGEN